MVLSLTVINFMKFYSIIAMCLSEPKCMSQSVQSWVLLSFYFLPVFIWCNTNSHTICRYHGYTLQ